MNDPGFVKWAKNIEHRLSALETQVAIAASEVQQPVVAPEARGLGVTDVRPDGSATTYTQRDIDDPLVVCRRLVYQSYGNTASNVIDHAKDSLKKYDSEWWARWSDAVASGTTLPRWDEHANGPVK